MASYAPSAVAAEEPSETDGSSTYDFHGLYRVRVAHRGLDAVMRRDLGVFLADGTDADLTITEGDVPAPPRSLLDNYSYGDTSFVIQTPSGRISVDDGHILAEPRVAPNELLGHWVENLMKMAILRRGVCFVHSAAVARDGAAFLFPAWMGSGKTHLLLRALHRGFDYMADDWSFVTESGEALGYPRWPNLVYHHFKANPALRGILAAGPDGTDLRRRLAVSDFADTFRPSGRLAQRFRRFLDDRFFVMVNAGPTQLFPRARCVLRAPVSRVALLLPSEGSAVEIRPTSAEALGRRTIWAGAYERSLYADHRLAMAFAGKGVPQEDTTEAEAAVLSKAFRSARCFEVVLPTNPTFDDLDRVLDGIE